MIKYLIITLLYLFNIDASGYVITYIYIYIYIYNVFASIITNKISKLSKFKVGGEKCKVNYIHTQTTSLYPQREYRYLKVLSTELF